MFAYILEVTELRRTTQLDEAITALRAGQTVWIHLDARTPQTEALLADDLKIHPLVIEDVWSDRGLPKLEDFDDYLYIIVHGVKQEAEVDDVRVLELDIILGKNYVITYAPESRSVVACEEDLLRSPRLLKKGPVWLLHGLLDHLVDHYFPVMERFDAELEGLDAGIMRLAGTPEGQVTLQRIFDIKRSLLTLRRMSIHQRDILLRLSRGEFDEIPEEAVPFFRDVYDHFARFTDFVESYRDLVASALEAYLSVQSNRMNEVMKTLTLMSTIMLPITFIAGVYGMNFDHMPELRWPFGYAFALGLMASVAGGILLLFRRKRWL